MKKARKVLTCMGVAVCAAAVMVEATTAALVTIDFETDDNGNPLVNGQAISSFARADRSGVPFSTDTVLEFGTLLTVDETIQGSDGHLGPVIFDSTPNGPNQNSQDPDLLVDKGNILILQSDNPASATTTTLDATYGLLFDNPNDEADFADHGSIVFDFLNPVEPVSIDLIDINGGAHVTVTLTDVGGLQRVYDVPTKWTTDVTNAPAGWQTLFLNTLNPQPAEPNATGNDATVIQNDVGFDSTAVIQLDVLFDGSPSSAGMDNLVFIVPEPATVMLLGLGLLAMVRRGCGRC